MFIVLESIDGGGKGRQRIEVSDVLDKEYGIEVKGVEFPIHDVFYESIIHPALQKETKMSGPSWILAFLLEKTLYAHNIEPFVSRKGNLFIADGYFTTTIAYQSLLMKQVPLDRLLQYGVDFEIPKPDLTIFLDVDPKVAIERKNKEEGHDEGPDMFEESIEKQENLRQIFKKMVDEKIYCEWEMVDGNGSIDDVRDSILEVLKKRAIIK